MGVDPYFAAFVFLDRRLEKPMAPSPSRARTVSAIVPDRSAASPVLGALVAFAWLSAADGALAWL